MDFGSSCVSQHADDPVAGRAADDGVVDHNDSLSFHRRAQRVQFHLDCGFSAVLGWFDEGSSHIAVLHESLSEGDPALHAESQGSHIAGLRNADDQICVYRAVLCQISSGKDPGIVHGYLIDL